MVLKKWPKSSLLILNMKLGMPSVSCRFSGNYLRLRKMLYCLHFLPHTSIMHNASCIMHQVSCTRHHTSTTGCDVKMSSFQQVGFLEASALFNVKSTTLLRLRWSTSSKLLNIKYLHHFEAVPLSCFEISFGGV